MTRQSTSTEILDVDWDYPVADKFADEYGKGPTRARRARLALPADDAFAKIAKEDPRPLLILRECTKCKGTEHALFSRRLNNEKTKLLLHWFHCVKLPPEVAKANHPFHKVFTREKGAMPHLFISTTDGATRVDFDGSQPQTVLQKELVRLIDISYEKKPVPAIKAMMKFLSQFDMFDLREAELVQMLDKAREKHGYKSPKVKKLQAKIAMVKKDKAAAMKRAKAVCDLKLTVVKDKKAD